jgi:hypothetical protein
MNVLAKKIPTVVGLLLLVATIVGGVYLYRVMKPQVATGEIPTKVKITNLADNKLSVSWITAKPTLGSVQYGVVGDKLGTKASDDRNTGEKAQAYQTHHVTLTGLQPSTQYAFRILSGDKQTVFDNNGSPYSATTGPLISNTPLSKNFYGTVQLSSKQLPGGAIVYLSLPGATTASTLVTESGNYVITLSTIRSSDLKTYASFDPEATIATVNVDSGSEQSTATVSLANAAPVPVITLGQNADFRNLAPQIAQIAPTGSSTPSASSAPTTPGIFNVEPLSGAGVNSVTTTDVAILNPMSDGESLATLRPEFRGTGPAGLTLSIALTGQKAISDTTSIGADGTWTWSPVIDLKTGKQTITVSYVGTGGTAQKISRSFTISSGVAGVDPAFVSSPSASTKVKASATPKPSANTRVAMPATDSGVPVTGVIEPTLLTGLAGVVIMVVGATLLAL